MSTRDDPLVKGPESPDRLFYATGVLLDAQDFEAEQRYHRGRLARALAYTQGAGTVAGLRVMWQPPEGRREERLLVEPGMAIDRLGRIIEVPRVACMRLGRWYDESSGDAAERELELIESHRETVTFTPDVVTRAPGQPPVVSPGTTPVTMTGVVVDLFVNFAPCERGKTPAFATGPFDALDAVQPSRLRDGYKLSLVPRRVGLPLPQQPWSELDGVTDPVERRRKLQALIFGAWRETRQQWTDRGLRPGPEHVLRQDPTAVFLARIVIPATRNGPGRPQRDTSEEVEVDNHSRLFVYVAGALARAAAAL